jgi:hypothetical protein
VGPGGGDDIREKPSSNVIIGYIHTRIEVQEWGKSTQWKAAEVSVETALLSLSTDRTMTKSRMGFSRALSQAATKTRSDKGPFRVSR